MQPSQTKKTEASNAVVVLPWHPNFRNYDRLPDIKVVRTTFFVNTVALTVTLLLTAWVASREYHLSDLNRQIAESEAQIGSTKRTSEAAVQLFSKFQAEERRFTEVQAFIKSRHSVTPLLRHLGDTLPKGIALTYFDLRPDERGKVKSSMLILRGIARGSADQATGRASSFEAQLRKDEVLKPLIESVTLTNAARNPADDRLSFEIQIKFNPSSK